MLRQRNRKQVGVLSRKYSDGACDMKPRLLIAGCAVLALAAPLVARAQGDSSGGNPAAGRAFALETCTPCHLVSPDQLSPRRLAGPPFKAIANTRGMTATALHAFLTTPHPTMPNLILSPQEANNVIAYNVSLRDRS